MAATPMETPPPTIIRTIEWDMMDKRKFFPLSMLSSFSVRCTLYPLTVVKTRIQLQKHNSMYSGTIDALQKIYKYEGVSGLYRGFGISSIQIVSGVFYITTYESVRQFCTKRQVHDKAKSFIAGGAASLVGQTIIVPFDVISQHLMVLGVAEKYKALMNPLGLEMTPKTSRLQAVLMVSRKIMQIDGLSGFYRGYFASLSSYVPNSAFWWTFYHFYQDELYKISPPWMSQILIQSIAGTLGGFTTTVITNPLDIVRARLQVQRVGTMSKVFVDLWHEEGFRMFVKGLSARLVQSACFSFSIIVGYETIKRISVIDEYKQFIRW